MDGGDLLRRSSPGAESSWSPTNEPKEAPRMARRPAACAAPSRRAHVAGVGAERGRRGCRWDRSHATDAQTLPAVGLRPFRSADAPVLRRWAAAPERFLGVEDLLACADVPGIETSVAIDDGGRIVAVFQVASEGWLRAGMRSIALLVHPGRRGAGFGRASLPAAAGGARLRGQRAAGRHRRREHGVAALLRSLRLHARRRRRFGRVRGLRPPRTGRRRGRISDD